MGDDGGDPFPKLGSVYRGPCSKFSKKGTLNYKQTSGNGSKAWGNPNVIQKPTKWGNGESQVGQGNNNNSQLGKSNGKIIEPFCDNISDDEYDDASGDENTYDSEDEIFSDSDSGGKNYEGWKKSKRLRDFFTCLDKIPAEEINSEARTWHCPACKGGAGAIDWYYGLQALLNHARAVKTRKPKLHRMFADNLEYECLMRNVPLSSFGETFGLWVGLDKNIRDHEIVWPPMLVVMNTRFQRDDNNKWTGMGNQELLDCFSDYAALKARHAYGPQGHRGIGLLTFDTTTAGYLECVRLHKHFKEQGRDREAWDHCKNLFVPGGKRQLYGYMATLEDLHYFNQHSGKTRVKFEMRSYQEMVESKIKNINQDSYLLEYLKRVVAKERRQSEVIAETLSKVTDKLRKLNEENHIVRERTKEQNQENKEEMDAQEQFFRDQIQVIHKAIDAKEEDFEKLQQSKREVKLASYEYSSEKKDGNRIVENVSSFIVSQEKDMRKLEEERKDILKIHEEKQMALKKKQWEEQIELKKELENELTQLMSKYALNK